MKIENTDIREFGAKLLKVNFTPPATTIDWEMYQGALLPSENNTDVPLSQIETEIYFKGKDRDEILANISNFSAMLQKGVALELDGYRRKFMAYQSGAPNVEKTVSKQSYKATYRFDGYWFSEMVELHFNEINEFSFETIGNRPTPCIISVTSLAHIDELKITGFTEEILISNIGRGEEIVIDGEQGTVTVDGKNKFQDVTLWEFPFLQVMNKRKNNIVISSNRTMVTIRYRPLWM